MRSIRTKLTLWLSALVIISTLLGMLLMESMLRQAFHDSIIARLQEDMEQVILATHLHNGEVSINRTELSSFYKPAYSGRYYQLNFGEQEIRSRSLWDKELKITPLAPGETRAWQAKGPKKHDIQLLSFGLNSGVDNVNATLTVAQDLSIGRKVLAQVYSIKVGINLAMLIAIIIGIFIVLRRSFKPVAQIKSSLKKLRDGEISALNTDNIPTEIKPLAETYNELLDYTSKQIERSRNNLGNLSHGLKTPLAVMQQQVEALGLSDPDAALALQKQLDSIQQMVERKLAAARITGDMLPAAQLVIERDIDDLTQTLAKVHRHKQIDCKLMVYNQLQRLPIHREDGMEMLGNLLDNAYKWANSMVLVSIKLTTDKRIELTIEDDGTGVAKQDLAKLTQRGKRLDEAVMGHGLGLSIVKDIAEQYHIDIQFSQSVSLGGLKIQLTFSHSSI
ncbi:sensor histidine kinase [Shewanella marina]|uniref:sensor histidine kinase n=1 Tax=Shewanella marina TaxID=487319 RepID=UPI00047153EA|nr:sensor histidine kinase [Shewanella marina]